MTTKAGGDVTGTILVDKATGNDGPSVQVVTGGMSQQPALSVLVSLRSRQIFMRGRDYLASPGAPWLAPRTGRVQRGGGKPRPVRGRGRGASSLASSLYADPDLVHRSVLSSLFRCRSLDLRVFPAFLLLFPSPCHSFVHSFIHSSNKNALSTYCLRHWLGSRACVPFGLSVPCGPLWSWAW